MAAINYLLNYYFGLATGFVHLALILLIGWGLQYLDYLTPVALIGLLFIFPLREVTPRSPRAGGNASFLRGCISACRAPLF
jgi:hypothetical protein